MSYWSPDDDPDCSHVWDLAEEAWFRFVELNPNHNEDQEQWEKEWAWEYGN